MPELTRPEHVSAGSFACVVAVPLLPFLHRPFASSDFRFVFFFSVPSDECGDRFEGAGHARRELRLPHWHQKGPLAPVAVRSCCCTNSCKCASKWRVTTARLSRQLASRCVFLVSARVPDFATALRRSAWRRRVWLAVRCVVRALAALTRKICSNDRAFMPILARGQFVRFVAIHSRHGKRSPLYNCREHGRAANAISRREMPVGEARDLRDLIPPSFPEIFAPLAITHSQ